MTDLIAQLRDLLGTPPAGLEFFEYVFAGILLIILCMSAISLVSSIFNWVGGR